MAHPVTFKEVASGGQSNVSVSDKMFHFCRKRNLPHLTVFTDLTVFTVFTISTALAILICGDFSQPYSFKTGKSALVVACSHNLVKS